MAAVMVAVVSGCGHSATRGATGKIRFEDGDSRIFVMNPDGTGRRAVAKTIDDLAGVGYPSPDGSKVVFAVRDDRYGPTLTTLYVANADGSGRRAVLPHIDTEGSPLWSPDGRWVAYTIEDDALWDTYLLRSEGKGYLELEKRVPLFRPDTDVLAWSPDSAELVLEAWPQEAPTPIRLFVLGVNRDGSPPRRLYLRGYEPGSRLDWLKGGRLLYNGRRGGGGRESSQAGESAKITGGRRTGDYLGA
jgi:Tol biopolymer transport system component